MVVRIVKTDFAGNNPQTVDTFNDMSDAIDFGTKRNSNQMPMRLGKFSFMWETEDGGMMYTDMEYFYQFHIGSIVQSDNNNSQYRFYDAKVIDCFANGFFPMYTVRLADGSERIVREKDIRLQRLF